MNTKFDEFVEKLKTKFNERRHLVTEDLIRYWYIKTVGVYDGVVIEKPYHILLESISQKHDSRKDIPLQNGKRNRADLYYEKDDVVIEFKYHKKIDTSTSCKTDNFGYVINDLNKLSLLKGKRRLLIYVFDQEMYDYYQKNGHRQLIAEANCGKDSQFDYGTLLNQLQLKSARKSAFTRFCEGAENQLNYQVKVIRADRIIVGKTDQNIYLRVYEVLDK